MRVLVTAVAVASMLWIPSRATAQDAPVGFGNLEMARSRDCVGVLTRMDVLNAALQPLGVQAERLRVLTEAIALEDRDIMPSLDQTNAVEAAIHAWFVADGLLAQSFLDSGNEDLRRQRGIGREQLRGTIQGADAAVQAQAQAVIDASGDLAAEAGPCDGAIFVRSAVVEACQSQTGPVCAAAATPGPDSIFRFVDSSEELWDVQELRPWTTPGPLRVAQNATLTGARTVAFARHGNIVISVAFAPMIQERASLSEEEITQFAETLDSLGLVFEHPLLSFAPSLAVRATLPESLAGENIYALHFGSADDADVVWTAPAGTGGVLESPVVLQAHQVVRLQNGEALTLTAIVNSEGDDNEAVYSLDVTTVNQSSAVRGLLGYMAQGMAADLLRLIPPGGGG